MDQLDILLPDDFHVHLRQGPAMAAYALRSAAHCGRVLAMPNVIPAPTNLRAFSDYTQAARTALAVGGAELLPSFKLIPGMGAQAVLACATAGAVAGKYYPAGATTNSADGVADPSLVAPELAAMEQAGLVLSVHGEDPSAPVLEREEAFLPVLDRIIAAYPKLRVVMEHLSTASAVRAVLAWPERVAATITAHHLCFTIDDLAGERLDSSYFCKPILKTAADRAALMEAACSGSKKFFFGSDSAPHPAEAKRAGAAGSYSAPVAIPLLAGAFEQAGALTRLQAFCSEHGARFYRLAPARSFLRLTRADWDVAHEIDGVVPLAAGKTLRWKASR